MKTILKISVVLLPLLISAPSFAHVSWGIDIRFGSPPPPPREIIVARPYSDAIWVPGYYNYYPGHRYNWNPGYWRRQERFEPRHEIRGREFHDRDGDRNHDRDHGDHGREGGDTHRGRIR